MADCLPRGHGIYLDHQGNAEIMFHDTFHEHETSDSSAKTEAAHA